MIDITLKLTHLEVGHGVVVVAPARGPVAAARGAVPAPATARHPHTTAVRLVSNIELMRTILSIRAWIELKLNEGSR